MLSWNHKPQLRRAQNSDFHAGEIWEYRTRPGESGSTFRVLRVEMMPDNSNVVHVELVGLKIPNPLAPGGFTALAGHLPVSETALSACATRKRAKEEAPAMPEGYTEWRTAWEAGRAGVFSISLAEIVQILDDAVAAS